ncbi:MAG: hypothetical protein PHN51_01280 [Candidatus Nanopelagicales bacterium]|nr:hypothetical protein [Candidatus Nanopelagicales bacterium]
MKTHLANHTGDESMNNQEANFAWIQQNYTLQLLADSRTVRSPQEAVVAHLRCWEKVMSENSDCRSSILKLNIEDIINFRDTTLATITAEHYGYTINDLAIHLRIAA